MLDTVRGNLKQGLLSLLGIIDHRGLMVSVLGTFYDYSSFYEIYKVQKGTSLDIYHSTKTGLTTFLLWGFSLFAPSTIKQGIRDSLKQVEELAAEDQY
jgi:hypothetical protein